VGVGGFAGFGDDDAVGSLPLRGVDGMSEACIKKEWKKSRDCFVHTAERGITDAIRAD
jgi:hypothetical protein